MPLELHFLAAVGLKLKNRRVEKGGMLDVEVKHSWVPPQVVAQGYQAPVGAVASLGVTMVM